MRGSGTSVSVASVLPQVTRSRILRSKLLNVRRASVVVPDQPHARPVHGSAPRGQQLDEPIGHHPGTATDGAGHGPPAPALSRGSTARAVARLRPRRRLVAPRHGCTHRFRDLPHAAVGVLDADDVPVLEMAFLGESHRRRRSRAGGRLGRCRSGVPRRGPRGYRTGPRD